MTSKNNDRMKRWRKSNVERCRAYDRKWKQNWRRNNHDIILDYERLLRLANPERYKERDRKRYAINPTIKKKSHQKWIKSRPNYYYTLYWKNPIKARAKTALRRARKKHDVKIPNSVIIARIKKLSYTTRCYWCSKSFNYKRKLEIDHVIPLSRGGKHEPNNLVAACRKCNATKSNKLPSEWSAK